MTTWTQRTKAEQTLIRNAYNFEMEAIRVESSEINPYFDEIMSLSDGKELWEAVNVAVEMAFNS